MIHRSVSSSFPMSTKLIQKKFSWTWPALWHNNDYCCRDSEQVLTCCFNCSRCSSGIPHSAAVCAKDVSYTLVNGEHSLIRSCGSISHHLCLLVCIIESYRSPILPPSDSGSRPTSGGAGEGPGSLIIPQCSSSGCTWNKRTMEWTLFQE